MNLEHYIRVVEDYPKPGVSFKDITPLLQSPEAFHYCIAQMARGWEEKIDVITGFDARGFLFAAPLSVQMGVPLVMLRKQGKLPCKTISETYEGEYAKVTIEAHADAITKGQRVLLVDDVLAVGGAMRAGCNLVERLGGVVVGCQVLIEIEKLNDRKKISDYELHSLIKYY